MTKKYNVEDFIPKFFRRNLAKSQLIPERGKMLQKVVVDEVKTRSEKIATELAQKIAKVAGFETNSRVTGRIKSVLLDYREDLLSEHANDIVQPMGEWLLEHGVRITNGYDFYQQCAIQYIAIQAKNQQFLSDSFTNKGHILDLVAYNYTQHKLQRLVDAIQEGKDSSELAERLDEEFIYAFYPRSRSFESSTPDKLSADKVSYYFEALAHQYESLRYDRADGKDESRFPGEGKIKHPQYVAARKAALKCTAAKARIALIDFVNAAEKSPGFENTYMLEAINKNEELRAGLADLIKDDKELADVFAESLYKGRGMEEKPDLGIKPKEDLRESISYKRTVDAEPVNYKRMFAFILLGLVAAYFLPITLASFAATVAVKAAVGMVIGFVANKVADKFFGSSAAKPVAPKSAPVQAPVKPDVTAEQKQSPAAEAQPKVSNSPQP